MANQSAERETGRQFTSRGRLDACFAWRALPSFLIVYAGRLLVKKFTLPSSSLALDQGGNSRYTRCADALCSIALRVSLDATCISALVERQLAVLRRRQQGTFFCRWGGRFAQKNLAALGRRHPCLVATLNE